MQQFPKLCIYRGLNKFIAFYTSAILTKQVAAGQRGYDYLYNLRKLFDFFSPQFQSEYNTHEELGVDEAMIPFKGLLSIKQYMKDKPTKWGIGVC